MPNYQQGKIYKVVNLASNDACDCYVGSTCNSLSKRFSTHKTDSKRERYKNTLLYQKFREYGIDNFRIVLVEEFPCENSDQLRAREEHYRIQFGAAYNKNRALTTEEERKQDCKEFHHKNYEQNDEKICQYQKDYYKDNKDKVLKRVQEYSAKNQDKIKEYQKQYHEQNKDKLKQCRKTHECECGSKYLSGGRSQHLKTKKHIEYMKTVTD